MKNMRNMKNDIPGILVLTAALILAAMSFASADLPDDRSPFSLEIRGAATTTLTVNLEGGADYVRIQDAINAAEDGYTILVSGGTTRTLSYQENVIVNKRL